MSHLRMFGLAVIAASALTAFAGVSTTYGAELTCSPGVMCAAPTHIHAVNEGTVELHPIIGNIECTSSTKTGKASTGSASSTVSTENELETVTFGGCNATVKVLKPGRLEVHTRTANADGNGTVTWKFLELQLVFSGITCTVTTGAGIDIGTLTGSKNTGSTATLDVGGNEVPVDGAFCGGTLEMAGRYTITTPDYLDVD